MKPVLPFFACLLLCVTTLSVKAQNFDNPLEYMEFISKQQMNISKKFLAYASASAHNKKDKKVEILRSKLLDEVQESRGNINSMPSFQGDKTYRDTAVNFMKLYFNVLNEDYGKIVNMEEVAEQSYDAMEAYMLAKELAGEKLDEANDRLRKSEKLFAEANNIKLLESTSEMGKMMDEFSEVNKYYKEIYLIFFKPYKQEAYLMEALEKGNITGIEQSKNSLLRYAQEGFEKLRKLAAFKSDASLLNSCKRMMEFYITEADKVNISSNFFLTKERFNGIKKDFDKKSSPAKEDVDAYNKAVADMNKSAQEYNSNSNLLNGWRKEKLDDWNETTDNFFDSHSPHYN
jgi:hypothetical protein